MFHLSLSPVKKKKGYPIIPYQRRTRDKQDLIKREPRGEKQISHEQSAAIRWRLRLWPRSYPQNSVCLSAGSTNRLSSPHTGGRPDNADNEDKKKRGAGACLFKSGVVESTHGSWEASSSPPSLPRPYRVGGEMRRSA
jgi:hypothetical protein